MMGKSRQASVIIVSRHRPQALQRCIAALRLQDHDHFELIVVADPAALMGIAQFNDMKKIAFDDANIAAARNLGLMVAASDIVAFIDDDAVAEPTWLSRLIGPFVDPTVVAATGFVRGRNGISYQWRACEVDHMGNDHALDVTQTVLIPATPMRAVKTQGTNCAFRADPLRRIGGFDPAFHFYLDEADVNLRLAPFGVTAIVPSAEVHHGFLQSAYRRRDRVPTSLFEIGASVAVFLRRHASCVDNTDIVQKQGARLAALRQARKLSAAQAADLMDSLHQGWAAGLDRPLRQAKILSCNPSPFLPLDGIGPRGGIVLSGRIWSRESLINRAKIAVQQGKIVTVICLSHTPYAHWMQFTPDGYWLQTGGIWGRSNRQSPRILWGGFTGRIDDEIARIEKTRPVTDF